MPGTAKAELVIAAAMLLVSSTAYAAEAALNCCKKCACCKDEQGERFGAASGLILTAAKPGPQMVSGTDYRV